MMIKLASDTVILLVAGHSYQSLEDKVVLKVLKVVFSSQRQCLKKSFNLNVKRTLDNKNDICHLLPSIFAPKEF